MPTLFQFIELYGGLIALFCLFNLFAYKLFYYYKKAELERLVLAERQELKKQRDEIKDKLRKVLDSHIHIDKSRFDKEFIIYEDLWAALSNIDHKSEVLQKLLASDTSNEKKKNGIKLFANVCLLSVDAIHRHTPFYADDIYPLTQELISQLEKYIQSVNRRAKGDLTELVEWTIDHNKVYANSLHDELEKAIRERLESLAPKEADNY